MNIHKKVENFLSDFGENLSDMLEESNISPYMLANSIGVDRSEIYKYLRKENMPSLHKLILIADRLNCSIDYLLGLGEENPDIIYKPALPFSECFKKMLDKCGKSRYRFYNETHFAKQSIDDWYHGKRAPTVENTVEIAKYFNCGIDCLLCRE